jgi:hypothetical protein
MSNGPPPSGCPPPSFERVSTWNDANGASFVLSGVDATLSDAHVLYARASWAWWGGGRVFSQRRMGTVANLSVHDIDVADPLPTLNAFQIDESDGPPGTASARAERVGASSIHRSFHDVSFHNVAIANLSTVRSCPADVAKHSGCNCVPACAGGPLPSGIPNQIRGGTNTANQNNISRLHFNNVTIGGHGLWALPPSWLNVSGDVSQVTVDGRPWP